VISQMHKEACIDYLVFKEQLRHDAHVRRLQPAAEYNYHLQEQLSSL